MLPSMQERYCVKRLDGKVDLAELEPVLHLTRVLHGAHLHVNRREQSCECWVEV